VTGSDASAELPLRFADVSNARTTEYAGAVAEAPESRNVERTILVPLRSVYGPPGVLARKTR
jgi:hypothetical protein